MAFNDALSHPASTMPFFSRTELADLYAFLVIHRRRSLGAAATELGVTTSALSHTLRRLEEHLGVRLLHRTSRSLAPTAAGEALAGPLAEGLGQVEAAVAALQRFRDVPAGHLRLNVPRDAAHLLLTPVLALLRERYPELVLDVTVDDNLVDIVAQGFDAGMRYGNTVPQDMVAVPLTGPLRWVVVGAPAYFARHGRPRTPAELLQHSCIRMRLGDGSSYRWELRDAAGAPIALEVPGPVSFNETDSTVQAAVQGVGLAYCLQWRVARELAAGQLQTVLAEHAVTGPPLSIYYASRRQPVPGLKPLIEVLQRHARQAQQRGEAAPA
jgi:DNA-binding transcriptional LysR family regulator